MITAVLILAAALVVAAYLTYTFHKEDDDLPFTTPTYTKEELENIKLAEELYNKDLRQVVAIKAKTKPASELEVIEPEFVEKVFSGDSVLNQEEVVETPKPAKKKRKYYPKKKK
jgi:hypothetical protein